MVLACASGDGASGDGTILPLMMNYPGVRLKYRSSIVVPEGTCLGCTVPHLDGWTRQHFMSGLPIILNPLSSHNNGIKNLVLLLAADHATHINLDTSEFCNAHGIVLNCLLHHAICILQPLDISVFKELKSHWLAAVREFLTSHVGQFVSKVKFAGFFFFFFFFTSLECSCLIS